jgi:hypothetical protein
VVNELGTYKHHTHPVVEDSHQCSWNEYQSTLSTGRWIVRQDILLFRHNFVYCNINLHQLVAKSLSKNVCPTCRYFIWMRNMVRRPKGIALIKGVWEEYLDLSEKKEDENGENCMRNLKIFRSYCSANINKVITSRTTWWEEREYMRKYTWNFSRKPWMEETT